jgi:thymidylate synthase
MEVNRLDERYRALLAEVLHNGIDKADRTGTGTLSRFGMTIRHRMEDGFPVLTTKKIPLKTVATELKWFLKGRTDLRYLLENNCHIWTGDAYKVYERVHHWDLEDPDYDIEEFENQILVDDDFSRLWGNLGFIYGKQWRDWNGTDQLKELINNLKSQPNSRRHIVSAWNVDDLIYMKLPPCHYAFQCYVADGKLSLMWQQRSADLFLGVPFNISSYGMLLLLLCKETGYEPGELIGNFGDIHLYKNHIEQAKEQINRKPYDLPKLSMLNVDLDQGEFNFVLDDYNYHPAIKAPLSN